MDCSMPGSPVLHYLLEFAEIHIHWVGDAIQPGEQIIQMESFLPGESQGQRSLMGCRLWGHRGGHG